MDVDNNFDSDTSESWSLIDLNCDHTTDINLTDEIGAEAFETKLEEVENSEQSPAFPAEQEENGSPGNIIAAGNDGNVASGNDHPKNQPDYRVYYQGPMFEDESDDELYSNVGVGRGKLEEAQNIDPVTKDLDDDTDGISVISESEFNEGKVNAYESDEIWDEKPSDSDANENQTSNNWKNGKAAKENNGESSEKSGSSGGMGDDGSCCSQSCDAGKNENGTQRKQPVAPPVYRPNRNNRPGFVLRLAMAIVLSGISYIILGYFCGEEDSLRAANNMAQTVRKLQKENLILHSRLTQLNRAVLARGVNKLDLKEETEPPCLKDEFDCRKINLKLYERNVDEANYDLTYPRNKDSLDFSIPLNHPKNVLAFKQILVGNEIVLARKSDETFEPFNFSKYMEALVSGQYTVATPSAPMNIAGEDNKPIELENEKVPEQPKDEEPGQKDEKPEDTNCQKEGSTTRDDEAQKENCLAIEEKDLSQFRWFILKDKPKCSGIKVEDLEELESECLYKIPMEKIYGKKNTDEPEDSAGANAKADVPVDSGGATAKADVPEDKDDPLKYKPSARVAAISFHAKSHHDRDKQKKPAENDSRFKKTKKRAIYLGSAKRYLDYGKTSAPKKKVKIEKEKGDDVYADKYLKHFAKVEKEIKENKGRVKECVMGKDGKCELKFKDADENDQAQDENYKKNGEKRSKPDGERKNNKKDQLPKGKKDKANFRPKKWKTCSIKPDLKCGNDSQCDDCSCKTGDWFSKWAEGREKCRRDQKISDWQFDRAKSREYSRIGDAFWQFTRAYGRQNRRMYPFSRKKKAKYFPGKGPGFKPDSLK